MSRMNIASGKREIYEGKYNDECSADDFLAFEGLCQEVFHEEDENEDRIAPNTPPHSLEDSTDLECTTSHLWICHPVRSYLQGSNMYPDMMKSVRYKFEIPLIQIWAPCLCDTATRCTELFCHLVSTDHNMSDIYGEYTYMASSHGARSLKNGKGLVGRAFSQTKCCFVEDTSRFSISDNLLVYNCELARSFNFTACFAIPLQSIDPSLHPFILEVFLLPQQNCDHGYVGALLKSILATVYEQLLLSGEFFGLTADEEFNVELSNTDDENFVYFSVKRFSRTRRTGAVPGDDEIERSFSLTVKATCRGKTAMFPLHNNLEIEELHKELGKRFKLEVGRLGIKYKDEGSEWIVLSCNEDLRFHVQTLKSSDQSTLILEINPIEEAEITLEKINRHRGCTTQKEAAKKLDVSLSTLKRRCRELGLKRWPFSKRKNVHGLHSSARLKKTINIQECEIGHFPNADAIENEGVSGNRNGIETEDDETGSHENVAAVANSTPTSTKIGNVLATENDEIELFVTNNARNSVAEAANSVPVGDIGEAVSTVSNIIAVMATYKDDTILFPLSCNSGIEALRMELEDAFQFGAQKFKVKYKHDDGIWITLLRDKDFRFHIDTLKALGQSTVKLSVFPVPL